MISVGAELKAVRGAAPEFVMAGDRVDASDHRAAAAITALLRSSSW